ncbi:MAG: prephenate dehydratase [Thermoanaerobaculia bacterium]
MRVAYQGERGAFSESAARRLLGETTTVPFASFEEMFDAVRRGDADCCVAPIENSLAGSIHRNYDLLLDSDLAILGETNLRIVHNLLGAHGTSVPDLRRVYSHPVALAQCGRFLRANPHIEPIPVHDPAGAVRIVMERGSGDEAAIASERAGTIYGAATLASGIEDHAQNFTRFFLAAPAHAALRPVADGPARRWKTSLLLRVTNKPGALFRALGAFALREIDLSKIESRPIEGRPWEYAFYVDVVGNAAEEPLAGALENLRAVAELVKVLGSYPTRW